MRNLLFHIEFLINNGACLIHEGNRDPGRGIKNSLIHREMVKELTSDNLRALTGDCPNNPQQQQQQQQQASSFDLW